MSLSHFPSLVSLSQNHLKATFIAWSHLDNAWLFHLDLISLSVITYINGPIYFLGMLVDFVIDLIKSAKTEELF